MLHVVSRNCRSWRVINRTLLNPSRDELDITLGQWWLVPGHLRFTIAGRNLCNKVATGRVARHNRSRLALPTGQQPRKTGHHVLTVRLGRLMAPLTVRLKNWANLFVVTHLFASASCLVRGFGFSRREACCEKQSRQENRQKTFHMHDRISRPHEHSTNQKKMHRMVCERSQADRSVGCPKFNPKGQNILVY